MTQPPTGPPQGPPWGHYPQPAGQPPPKRGRGWEIVGGVVVGGIATVILPLMSLGVVDQTGGWAPLFVALLAVPALGVGLLFSESSRPWGIGILIGWAVALIVVGGTCVAILSSLS